MKIQKPYFQQPPINQIAKSPQTNISTKCNDKVESSEFCMNKIPIFQTTETISFSTNNKGEIYKLKIALYLEKLVIISPETQKAILEINLNKERIFLTSSEQFVDLLCKFGGQIRIQFKLPETQQNFLSKLKKTAILKGFRSKYERVSRIGEGAFAEIIKSKEKATGKLVAIKQYSNIDPEFKMKIIRETRLLRLSPHKNLAEILEVYEYKGRLIKIFEYLEGEDLWTEMEKIRAPEAKSIMIDILKGVAWMHGIGIIHRDLNPKNLMFRIGGIGPRDNICTILDFELCVNEDLQNIFYKKCGTDGFIAPEVIDGKFMDLPSEQRKKCDIYSLGAIFYLLIFKKLPEKGFFEKKKSMLNMDEVLIRKMMNQDVEKRPSASDIISHRIFRSSADFDKELSTLQYGNISNRCSLGDFELLDGLDICCENMKRIKTFEENYRVDETDDIEERVAIKRPYSSDRIATSSIFETMSTKRDKKSDMNGNR